MDGMLKQPKPMQSVGDLASNWKKFKSSFNIYMTASNGAGLPEDRKTALFLHIIGEEAQELFDKLEIPEGDKKNLQAVMQRYENYYVPKTNICIERHKFNMRIQNPNETFEMFHADLVKLASSCDFGDMKNRLIQDRIICGLRDNSTKNRLLREENLDLQRTLKICRAAVEAQTQLKQLNMDPGPSDTVIANINKQRNTSQRSTTQQNTTNPNANRKPERASHNNNKRICIKCGYTHGYGKCPAFGKMCNNCQKPNHFAKLCRFKKIHEITEEDESPAEHFMLNMVRTKEIKGNTWNKDLYVQNIGRVITFKLDTGAQKNVIPYKLLTANVKIKKTNIKLTSYTGQEIKVIGIATLMINYREQIYKIEFVTAELDAASPVLGLETLQELSLIARIDMIHEKIPSEFENLFEGIGEIKEIEYKIRLKENYETATAACRKVPFHLLPKLKTELEKLQKLKIIELVKEPTEFVNPIVLVKKPNNEIRICLDPQILNNACMKDQTHIPTFEELMQDLNNAKYFSTLDANRGFWQIKLDQESSKLTTFITPFGKFKFNRLSFGLAIAPEVFQNVFNTIFGKIPGVKIYIDDIFIFGKTQEEHDKTLIKVLETAKQHGVRFNKEKCKISVQEVKYVGHIITKDGIKLDPKRTQAILNMETPKNAKDLSRFLGMVNYVGRYIPNVSKLTSNLRELCKKDILFVWNDKHEIEFKNLKMKLAEAPVLQHFDEKLVTTLSVDSSKDGLGAVIIQNDKPVAYASKTLTETQQRYAQIEKEMLAIVFGCQRFHQYLYGKEFLVETDHKPLEIIFKKPLDKCPLRIQRLRITLELYNCIVNYKPGKKLYFADTLSRASIDDSEFVINEKELNAQISTILDNDDINRDKLIEIKNATITDDNLQILKQTVLNGWPASKTLVPDKIRQYWNIKGEIVIIDEILYKGQQIIIPNILRPEILLNLHYTHMGLEKTFWKAKELVYWPNIYNDIKNICNSCETCLKFSKANTKEPLLSTEIPDGPWQYLACDLFHLDGREYILLVDKYSKYVQTACLNNSTTSIIVIDKLKSWFSQFGKPIKLYTDNGPQFSSYEFKNFMSNWDITHITSSPRYPQSNGFIERYVQTVKKLLKKAITDNHDIYLTLLELRNTPIGFNQPTPAEIIFGRKIRATIPIKKDRLQPKYDITKIDNFLKKNAEKQCLNYNKTAHEKDLLKVNDNVRVREEGKWVKAKVKEVCNKRPRSFILEKENGSLLNRNRKVIKKVNSDVTNGKALYETLLDEYITGRMNEPEPNIRNESQNINPERGPHLDVRNVSPQRVHPNVINNRPKRIVRRPAYLKDYV